MKRSVFRGDIYYADLNPVRGSEQGGVRPVLVIQNNKGNKYAPTLIVTPVSSHAKKPYLPTHVIVPEKAGLVKPSIAMLEQIRTIDKSRLREFAGSVSDELMDGIDYAIRISLGIDGDGPEPPPEEMRLCLCPACASQLCSSPEHMIRRCDPFQAKIGECAYCSVRMGYDLSARPDQEEGHG